MKDIKLKIRKFKKINEEIILSDFEYINYIVGENGSGKTSILNSISFLVDGLNSKHFFGPESLVSLDYNGQNRHLFWNNENPNKTEHVGNLSLNIHIIHSNIEQEKGANGLKARAKIDEKIAIENAETLKDLNTFLSEIGHSNIIAKKLINQDNPFDLDNGKLIFETDKGLVDPFFFADGLRALYNFKKNLKAWISSVQNTNKIHIFLIEEPENNLHPNLQKQIPLILESLYHIPHPQLRNKIFFFISTHSPFIISASSKFQNQKVYPMQNGKPLKIDFNSQTWIETNNNSGYNGFQCAYVVSKMLGADITDMGYPENYVILEEYSLQIILDSARTKGIIKNIQFVSASGVNKAINFSETIYELEKLNTLVKCNPYYYDKYFLIIDNLNEINDEKLKTRVNKLKQHLGQRFVELSLHSLEDYYLNINPELYKQSRENIQNEDRQNQGNIKANYARLISQEIVNKIKFSELFNGELDFLLA